MIALLCAGYLICWILSLICFCKLSKTYMRQTLVNSDIVFFMLLSSLGPISLLVCFVAWMIERPYNFTALDKITKFINEKL